MGRHFLVFVGAAAVLIVVPGPDMALVTKNAVLYGRRAALGTSLGVVGGLSLWTVASALGVASLVRASATAFTTLKLLGAAYLIWLGLQALWAASHREVRERPEEGRAKRVDARDGLRQGLVSNLANPKIAAFFTSLLPQFIGSGRSVLLPFLLLGGVFVAMTLVWLSAYALVAARASTLLQRPRVKRALDRLTGVILIGFGLRLATEHR
ncbi:MAG: LysE family translocator [Solirubrobacterales bacterium]|nr:LysE family translocator [Solirubrobacterales bacterium]